ncbi:hypothetical protein K435DRAFT_854460 [Dendrothele bispora CBS 962.96]|uniref:Uncharacterized protein n=1 Tax=Dendrothele bispora (strain CBS 962.96) TaxID=1314807 RepID=A0A4S8MDR8_DENBC|nr:hypothetical protein K435DRAFT_854460 [Dendrothele bispora CBS 962.96]
MESDGRHLAGVTVTKAFLRERRCICIDSAKLAGCMIFISFLNVDAFVSTLQNLQFPKRRCICIDSAKLAGCMIFISFLNVDAFVSTLQNLQFPKRRCICIDSAKLAVPYLRRTTTSTSIPDPRRLYPQHHPLRQPSIALTQRLRGQTTCLIESRLKEEERARKEWEGQYEELAKEAEDGLVQPHFVIVIVVTALFISNLSLIPSSSTQPLQRCHEEAEDVLSKDIPASMHRTLTRCRTTLVIVHVMMSTRQLQV